MTVAGAVVLTVHDGAKPIEFERGKAAIAVGKKYKLIPTIETVIAAVEVGELDGVLARMSKTAVMTKGKRALIPIVVACDRDLLLDLMRRGLAAAPHEIKQ